MGLAILIFGLAVLLTTHGLTTMRGVRQGVVDRLGLWPYKAVYSIVSLVGVVLIAYGFGLYRAANRIDIWHPPSWTDYVTVVLMWPAMILVVAAYIPGEIKRALKHPMLAGVKLWAVAHLISVGDLGSMILFGSILAWAVLDRISLKRRGDLDTVPVLAGGRRSDIVAAVVGTVLYLLIALWFHPMVIGVHVFGRPALGT
jgi:uncharacterized membrane protein